MNREEVLVRVADGEVIKGYKVIETGIDKAGKYKLIETPEGATEKVYLRNNWPKYFGITAKM
jgi:hypothetical protein